MEDMTHQRIRAGNIAEHVTVHHEEVEILLIDVLGKSLEIDIFSMYIAKHEEAALISISVESLDHTVTGDLHSALRTVVHSICTFVILHNLRINAVTVCLTWLETSDLHAMEITCDSSSRHNIIEPLTVTHLERSSVIRCDLHPCEILLR